MAKPPAKPPRQPTDWEAIERDYRTGKWSDSELARKYPTVTRQGIAKRALKEGWTKDRTEAVRQATSALLASAAQAKRAAADTKDVQEAVSKVVSTPGAGAVMAAAMENVAVITAHRMESRKARELAMAMLDELEMHTHKPEILEALLEKLTEDADAKVKQRALDRLHESINLPKRVMSMFRLSSTLHNLHGIERKAHSLDDGRPPPPDGEFTGTPEEHYKRLING